MNQRELEYFITAARIGTLSQAAEILGVSQPSLSAGIKRLEQSLGTKIFHRLKTGVVLTPAGQVLLNQGTKLIEDWQNLKSSINHVTTQVQGNFKIGSHAAVARHHFAKPLAKLLIAYPKLHIEMIHALSRNINQQLINMQLDIGLVVNPMKHPDLIIRKLYEDRIGCWHNLSMQQIKNKPLTLLCDMNLAQTTDILRKIKRKQIVFDRVIESTDLDLLAELAREKVGVAIIPESIAKQHEANELKQLEPSIHYRDEICLVYRHEMRYLAAIKAISKALSES